ncbi:MAG: 2-phospho-L-lactate transferase [Halobacteriales archaeon]|nr:2-phospho-L-lactate transferase [Halobacteriales archaeon]
MTDVTFLSGGTGTPKLLDGLDTADADVGDVSVVVNTGDDIEISGNLVCPDVDTVLYTLSGRIDRGKWWGIEGDTHTTHESLTEEDTRVERVESSRRLGEGRAFSGDGEFMRIGDDDRATHVLRTSALDSGATLTEATRRLADRMGVPDETRVLPVSDDRVATYIETPEGYEQFQVWWVAHEGKPEVRDVQFRGSDDAKPTDAVLDALDAPVIIGPSNPVTSIGPMLAVDGVRDALRETRVVAVSPFVGGEVVSGPAGKLMRATGLEASSRGVYDAYSDFIDVLVVDGEEIDVDDTGFRVVNEDTSIDGREEAVRLVERLVELVG